jgi:hypothetical protein
MTEVNLNVHLYWNLRSTTTYGPRISNQLVAFDRQCRASERMTWRFLADLQDSSISRSTKMSYPVIWSLILYVLSSVPWIHEHLIVKSLANFRDWSIRYHSRSRTFTVNERNLNNKSLKENADKRRKPQRISHLRNGRNRAEEYCPCIKFHRTSYGGSKQTLWWALWWK